MIKTISIPFREFTSYQDSANIVTLLQISADSENPIITFGLRYTSSPTSSALSMCMCACLEVIIHLRDGNTNARLLVTEAINLQVRHAGSSLGQPIHHIEVDFSFTCIVCKPGDIFSRQSSACLGNRAQGWQLQPLDPQSLQHFVYDWNPRETGRHPIRHELPEISGHQRICCRRQRISARRCVLIIDRAYK